MIIFFKQTYRGNMMTEAEHNFNGNLTWRTVGWRFISSIPVHLRECLYLALPPHVRCVPPHISDAWWGSGREEAPGIDGWGTLQTAGWLEGDVWKLAD